MPLRLPYPELSALATRYAAARAFPLPVPTHPTLRVLDVALSPAGPKLRAAVRLEVRGPLGLRVAVTSDVTGTPVLDSAEMNGAGRTLSLRDVTVQTRREGLAGRVAAWLADARTQAFIARAAHADLTPYLARAQAEAQARLPLTPAPGLRLSGTVGELSLTDLTVQPDALTVTAALGGHLDVEVDAGAVGR